MQPMYYIGLDVHKSKISYCVKDRGGAIHSDGSIPATRYDLDCRMKTLPPWSAAMEATMFSGWIYDHLKPHAAGASVLAHEKTKTSMAEPHNSALLGLHIPASPADALPQQTFSASQKLQVNGETVVLQYFQPAHTDTDIYIHFQKANVIHMGDTFLTAFTRSLTPALAEKSMA